MFYGWRPYVPVAQRRANAVAKLAKISKKTGRIHDPVILEGRKIATTFWGKAWCNHLESHSDFSNRLPRGRTYARNGSIVDLQIEQGVIRSRVSGSDLYTVEIRIAPLEPSKWTNIREVCRGSIGSLIELLKGTFSKSVMTILCDQKNGLFPLPGEFTFSCSCPDWASMCKHVAATLYGVGSRLDSRPELLFLLRGVDQNELIGEVFEAVSGQVAGTKAGDISESELSNVFGIEIDATDMNMVEKRPRNIKKQEKVKRIERKERNIPKIIAIEPTKSAKSQKTRQKKAKITGKSLKKPSAGKKSASRTASRGVEAPKVAAKRRKSKRDGAAS